MRQREGDGKCVVRASFHSNPSNRRSTRGNILHSLLYISLLSHMMCGSVYTSLKKTYKKEQGSAYQSSFNTSLEFVQAAVR